MRAIAKLSCGLAVLWCSGVVAQQKPGELPPDLQSLPTEIKQLQWKSIDTSALSPLEHCRALLLMNHALDELSANATAEADLMSSYIETKKLGSQFASTPPPPAPPQLGYADAEKVAVALLKGPMSQSYYATELDDVSATGLASYEQLYERTCQRRWSEFAESRAQVRAMASFLGNNQMMSDYQAWATAEAALRQQQYEKKTAAGGAEQQQEAAAIRKSDAEMQQLMQQNAQLRQALSSAEYQQQASAQQTAQAQQAAAQAQQAAGAAQQASQEQQQQQPAGYVVPTAYGAYGYGAYGGYGYGTAGAAAAGAYAGANAANRSNAASYAAGAYHGSNDAWTHDAGYSGAARAQTEQRMSGFHGAPAGRR